MNKHTEQTLIPAVKAYIQTYQDPIGRPWYEITNPSHVNAPFWQSITTDFDGRSITYNQSELKFAIKAAFARLKNAAIDHQIKTS